MPNTKNIEKVSELRKKLSKAKSVVFAEYHGLGANQENELRAKVIKGGGEMSIAKNTLVKLALKEEKMSSPEIEAGLEGPIATFFAYEDSIAPLKILADFAKKLELPKLKAGIIDGAFVPFEKLQILSRLPSRQELLASLARGLKSPLSGFVNVVGGNRRKLVYALSAIAEKRAKE